MRPDLEDLRLLRLAAFYEAAYERFVTEVAQQMVQGRTLKDGLRRLVDPTDDHGGRIAAEMARIAERLAPEDHGDLVRAALLDVVEIERSARDFYRAKLEEAHDEQVVHLFQRLAREEEGHLRIAERLLDELDADHREREPVAESLQFLHDLETFGLGRRTAPHAATPGSKKEET